MLPERRALARATARDQQRTSGVLAEPRSEQCTAGELADHDVLDLVGVEYDDLGRWRIVGVGQVHDDPVVGPQRLGVDAVLGAQPRADRQCPRSVDARAEGCEHAETPVADLVAEALDDDRAIRRQHTGRLALLAEVAK